MLFTFIVMLALQGYFWSYFWSLPAGMYDWVHISVMIVAVGFNAILVIGSLIDLIMGNTSSSYAYDY